MKRSNCVCRRGGIPAEPNNAIQDDEVLGIGKGPRTNGRDDDVPGEQTIEW